MTLHSGARIRTLRLTDIPEAVEIHQKAFPDFFLTFLGPGFLKLLYKFYITGNTEIALAAEQNGRINGTLLGSTEPKGFYRRLAGRHFLSFAWASTRPLLKRPVILPRLFRALFYRGDALPLDEGGALLASVCVEPSQQKKGLGGQLIGIFELEAWKRGSKFIYLLADREDNQKTQEFYQQLGWLVESEFSTPEGRVMQRYWKKAPHVTEKDIA
jgi:GNAT superfamily N-acetyltransferase